MASPEHVVQWVTPSPLWLDGATMPPSLQKPALFRFASDDFMKELAGVLASKKPSDVARYLAAWESDRAPPSGAPAGWTPPPPKAPAAQIKLYQPVHGRFYLVAAAAEGSRRADQALPAGARALLPRRREPGLPPARPPRSQPRSRLR